MNKKRPTKKGFCTRCHARGHWLCYGKGRTYIPRYITCETCGGKDRAKKFLRCKKEA